MRETRRVSAGALFLGAVAAACLFCGGGARLTALSVFASNPGVAVRAAAACGQSPTPVPAEAAAPLPAPTAPPAAVPSPTPQAAPGDHALWGDAEKPADAGAVLEKTYPQGSGDNYIPCGAGSIKNNTKDSAATVSAAVGAGLPFTVELSSDEPQVLILHTHATETYRLSEGLWHLPGDTARSTDRSVDMCAVGDVMAAELNAAGINTLHDTSLNDYPSYTGSYANSRAVAQKYLAQYPSIKAVLDVHRDAIETPDGAWMAPVCTVGGRQAAQVMIICGCNNGTTVKIPNYRENLRFAAAWETKLESMFPGFTRPLLFSYRFYNQDLTTGSLLIEIGGHGNNLNEALYAGRLAARGLAALFGAG